MSCYMRWLAPRGDRRKSDSIFDKRNLHGMGSKMESILFLQAWFIPCDLCFLYFGEQHVSFRVFFVWSQNAWPQKSSIRLISDLCSDFLLTSSSAHWLPPPPTSSHTVFTRLLVVCLSLNCTFSTLSKTIPIISTLSKIIPITASFACRRKENDSPYYISSDILIYSTVLAHFSHHFWCLFLHLFFRQLEMSLMSCLA